MEKQTPNEKNMTPDLALDTINKLYDLLVPISLSEKGTGNELIIPNPEENKPENLIFKNQTSDADLNSYAESQLKSFTKQNYRVETGLKAMSIGREKGYYFEVSDMVGADQFSFEQYYVKGHGEIVTITIKTYSDLSKSEYYSVFHDVVNTFEFI